jgi:voltage-gated potassium channel
LLIIANVAAVLLESVESIRRQFSGPFIGFEHSATAVFAVEYVLRVWACVDFRSGLYRDPGWGRLRYM